MRDFSWAAQSANAASNCCTSSLTSSSPTVWAIRSRIISRYRRRRRVRSDFDGRFRHLMPHADFRIRCGTAGEYTSQIFEQDSLALRGILVVERKKRLIQDREAPTAAQSAFRGWPRSSVRVESEIRRSPDRATRSPAARRAWPPFACPIRLPESSSALPAGKCGTFRDRDRPVSEPRSPANSRKTPVSDPRRRRAHIRGGG